MPIELYQPPRGEEATAKEDSFKYRPEGVAKEMIDQMVALIRNAEWRHDGGEWDKDNGLLRTADITIPEGPLRDLFPLLNESFTFKFAIERELGMVHDDLTMGLGDGDKPGHIVVSIDKTPEIATPGAKVDGPKHVGQATEHGAGKGV